MTPARILDGRLLAERLAGGIRTRAAALSASGLSPSLLVLSLRPPPPTLKFVRRIAEVADLLDVSVAADVATDAGDLRARIALANGDPKTHGITIAMPLPTDVDVAGLIALLDPAKDVDGQHPTNAGAVAQGAAGFVPATAAAIIALLLDAGIVLAGLRVVVVGRGDVVGRPTALLMLREGATVTVTHRLTRDLASHTREAELLVVAAGVPGLITPEHVRPGAVVIDAGINATPEGFVGDVDPHVASVAGALTPPGALGHLATTLLLASVVEAAERAQRAR